MAARIPLLFDVNAGFGRSGTGDPEFPTLAARIEHMDRIGIQRALVWNTNSKVYNASACNQRLLAEIKRTPGTEGRIVPALSVSGLMVYEKGSLQALRNQLQKCRTRALRFAKVFGRLTLAELDPVIRAVRNLRPFLVLRHDEAEMQDLLDFTDLFKDVPVILTEVTWPHCIAILDLMRRRANVLLDNSWLHTDGAVELVIKHFGPDRLVFGTGYRTHGGAAIAALARADLSAADRDRIAHRTLDHLLGTQAIKVLRSTEVRAESHPLWKRCLLGQPLGVDVVDAHAHIGPSGGYVLETQEDRAQITRALGLMQRLGVSTMIVSGMQALMGDPVDGNDLVERLLSPHATHFQGYVVFNPHYATRLVRELDRYFSGPVFVGFKTLCSYWGVTLHDVRFKSMWAYANRHRLPVLYHTWGDFTPRFSEIVRKYPYAQFLLGHSGGTEKGRRDAEKLAKGNPNVHLEWCGSFCNRISWEETLRKLGPRQVVFGSDAIGHDIHWEIGRLLSLDVPEATLLSILGRNMRRILAMRRR